MVSFSDTQQYVVTFKSPDSYMEVPGWHRGDLAFSFRTSSERAILLYQPLLHPKHPYFRVLLVDGLYIILSMPNIKLPLKRASAILNFRVQINARIFHQWRATERYGQIIS